MRSRRELDHKCTREFNGIRHLPILDSRLCGGCVQFPMAGFVLIKKTMKTQTSVVCFIYNLSISLLSIDVLKRQLKNVRKLLLKIKKVKGNVKK